MQGRKNSIVEKLERTGLAIESKIAGTLKRSAQSSKTDLSSSQSSSMSSLPEDVVFTMDPNDYELGSPIGMSLTIGLIDYNVVCSCIQAIYSCIFVANCINCGQLSRPTPSTTYYHIIGGVTSHCSFHCIMIIVTLTTY
jgi:hypothetical protein